MKQQINSSFLRYLLLNISRSSGPLDSLQTLFPTGNLALSKRKKIKILLTHIQIFNKGMVFLQKSSAIIVTKAVQVMQRLCQSELLFLLINFHGISLLLLVFGKLMLYTTTIISSQMFRLTEA